MGWWWSGLVVVVRGWVFVNWIVDASIMAARPCLRLLRPVGVGVGVWLWVAGSVFSWCWCVPNAVCAVRRLVRAMVCPRVSALIVGWL